MTNLHRKFQELDKTISLSQKQRDQLIKSRKALEDRIKKYFRENTKFKVPKFFIQGSYKTKTVIVKKDKTYDVDLGIIFNEIPDINYLCLQKHVAKAVKGHTKGGVQHKEKCIRVIYKGNFNIDLTVYHHSKAKPNPELATKTKWEKSNPMFLVDWYTRKKKNKPQLNRLVKYAKVWADKRSFKMPSGIALTVWLSRYYVKHPQDEVALINTFERLSKELKNGVICRNPAVPHDDLLLLSSKIPRMLITTQYP